MSNLEVELRYKVYDTEALIKRLAQVGIIVTKKEHLIDQWFMPAHVKSQAEEHAWFDENRGIAWRVRRTEKSDGTFELSVESKQLSEARNHNTFIEGNARVHDYDAALAMMTAKNYRCWLTIDKTRFKFDSGKPNIELILDEVAGLAEKIGIGAVLECEFTGEATRKQALDELEKLASSLGFTPDEQFEKSLTVESMSALADFGA